MSVMPVFMGEYNFYYILLYKKGPTKICVCVCVCARVYAHMCFLSTQSSLLVLPGEA